jgi:NAD kinase
MPSVAAALDRIAVVTRKTRLAELIERFNTRAQARFWIERAGGDFADYVREDDAYRRALDVLHKDLALGLRLQFFDRGFLPTFLFSGREVVVTLGQDGLVANTAKYAGEQPLVGVNPEPSRFDGVLLPFQAPAAREAVERVLSGGAVARSVTLAEAETHDGQRLLAFNDFYVGMRTHVSSRYRLKVGGREELQSSSGVLVSTGAGSTGWISSVYAMAEGVTRFGGGQPGVPRRLEWEDPRLLYAVREPFASRHSGTTIVAGLVPSGETLEIESRMPVGGVVFSDGMEADFLDLPAGSKLTIRSAEKRARLVVA